MTAPNHNEPKDLIKCPCCHGRGRVNPEAGLESSLADTLVLFTVGEQATVESLCAERPQVSANAMNNRVAKLHRIGLLRRHKVGRVYFYQRVQRERK